MFLRMRLTFHTSGGHYANTFSYMRTINLFSVLLSVWFRNLSLDPTNFILMSCSYIFFLTQPLFLYAKLIINRKMSPGGSLVLQHSFFFLTKLGKISAFASFILLPHELGKNKTYRNKNLINDPAVWTKVSSVIPTPKKYWIKK